MKITKSEQIEYKEIEYPKPVKLKKIPQIGEYTYKKRVESLINSMKKEEVDFVVIYADKEHFQNFEYFYGFEPRFEEGIAVIHKEGACFAILGNECLPLTKIAKVDVEPILCQLLSMPNQPMEEKVDLRRSFEQCNIGSGSTVGVIGWKLFPIELGQYYDIPHYILSVLQTVVGEKGSLKNMTHILIDPKQGLRNRLELEQIANFEFYTTMVAAGMLEAMEVLDYGKTEMEIGVYLNPQGMPQNCHANVSSGSRTITGLVSPSDNILSKGDPFTMCWGMRGALSCRAGYVASHESELPKRAQNYMDDLVKPYFAAAVSWYENIGLGVTGGDIYSLIQKIFPRETFGWILNPGHGIGSEEWMNSPFFENSDIKIKSGQMFQLDIIPEARSGCYTCNIEDGILIADQYLRHEIREQYPDIWERVVSRRKFMTEVLGINLKEETLPLYDTQGILNPLLTNKGYAMVKQYK